MSSLVVSMLLSGAGAAPTTTVDHPTLSQMWQATVLEAQVGVVYESENYVPDHAPPTPNNPCAKWTNYTDGSCQRLIYQPDGNGDLATRYLLGCDAVDCCKEQGEGPIEYQIPNVHPFARVIGTGKHEIDLFNGKSVVADGWSWKFTVENFTAYTTNSSDSEFATLVEWDVHINGQPFVNQYSNYTIIPLSQQANWAANFQVPKICQRENTLHCSNLHKAGKLSDKSMKFLRSGTPPGYAFNKMHAVERK